MLGGLGGGQSQKVFVRGGFTKRTLRVPRSLQRVCNETRPQLLVIPAPTRRLAAFLVFLFSLPCNPRAFLAAAVLYGVVWCGVVFWYVNSSSGEGLEGSWRVVLLVLSWVVFYSRAAKTVVSLFFMCKYLFYYFLYEDILTSLFVCLYFVYY